jgi:hypothetical protein
MTARLRACWPVLSGLWLFRYWEATSAETMPKPTMNRIRLLRFIVAVLDVSAERRQRGAVVCARP